MIPMKQLSLAETGFQPKAGKQTCKAVCLAKMETVLPWSSLEIKTVLSESGLSVKRGMVVETTLIAGVISTKSCDKKRGSEMSRTKKENQWQFGMISRRQKPPGGWFREEGCGQQRSEAAQLACMKNRTIDEFQREGNLSVLELTRKLVGRTQTKEQKSFNLVLSAVRVTIEHLFRVVTEQFGFMKARHQGLAKNTRLIVTLFVLANLWMARKRILPLVGEERTLN